MKKIIILALICFSYTIFIKFESRECRAKCRAFKFRSAVQSIACQNTGVPLKVLRDQMHDLFPDESDNLKGGRGVGEASGAGRQPRSEYLLFYILVILYT